MKMRICYILLLAASVASGELPKPGNETMNEVHARFRGQRGTFAQFGDSLTVTMAFFAPLRNERRNATPEMERAFEVVNGYMLPECWAEWKGLEFGSEGTRTLCWAREHMDEWLKRLNPETALIMFGSNDVQSLEADEFRKTLGDVVRKCHENGTVVILSTIPPRTRFVEKSAAFAQVIRETARERDLPLMDLHAEILRRRPDDWDGSSALFAEYDGYDVPTLLSRDGVHLSYPARYRNDYSEESLSRNGYALRSVLTLTKYAEVIETMLKPDGLPDLSAADESVRRLIRQTWFPKAPPLPPPTGKTARVASVDELFRAVAEAEPRTTILVADGHYLLPRVLEIRTDGVTLRSESGRRERVIFDGSEARLGELVGFRECSDVTVADLTIQNVKWNGFKINSETGVQRLTIRNCVIRNIWQRGVKGVKVLPENRDATRPHGVRVEYCLFFNDHPKRYSDDDRDTADNFGGNYVGGIDAMYAKDWVIADNVFIGIQGRTRGARGAVFLWHESEGCLVERNIIIDCDTGIALGNSHIPGDVSVHCVGFVVRNNFVTRAPENGIVADYTRDCRILHNTIHEPNSRLQRLIRLVHANDGLVVANNLLSGPEMRVETTSAVEFRGNVTQDLTDGFTNPELGDLHLTRAMPGVTESADRLEGVPADIDGQARSERCDVGADERVAR